MPSTHLNTSDINIALFFLNTIQEHTEPHSKAERAITALQSVISSEHTLGRVKSVAIHISNVAQEQLTVVITTPHPFESFHDDELTIKYPSYSISLRKEEGFNPDFLAPSEPPARNIRRDESHQHQSSPDEVDDAVSAETDTVIEPVYPSAQINERAKVNVDHGRACMMIRRRLYPIEINLLSDDSVVESSGKRHPKDSHTIEVACYSRSMVADKMTITKRMESKHFSFDATTKMNGKIMASHLGNAGFLNCPEALSAYLDAIGKSFFSNDRSDEIVIVLSMLHETYRGLATTDDGRWVRPYHLPEYIYGDIQYQVHHVAGKRYHLSLVIDPENEGATSFVVKNVDDIVTVVDSVAILNTDIPELINFQRPAAYFYGYSDRSKDVDIGACNVIALPNELNAILLNLLDRRRIDNARSGPFNLSLHMSLEMFNKLNVSDFLPICTRS
jgi:hypothetical protein